MSKPNDEINAKEKLSDDPLADTGEVVSHVIPRGVDRRTFLMRSAVVGATAVMTGRIVTATERTERSTAPAPFQQSPSPPLA